MPFVISIGGLVFEKLAGVHLPHILDELPEPLLAVEAILRADLVVDLGLVIGAEFLRAAGGQSTLLPLDVQVVELRVQQDHKAGQRQRGQVGMTRTRHRRSVVDRLFDRRGRAQVPVGSAISRRSGARPASPT